MFKRIRMVALMLCLALALPLVAQASYFQGNIYDGTGNWYTVNNPNPSDRLNLRTSPQANAPSIGKYYSGVAVYAMMIYTDGWMKVQIGDSDVTGYMQSRYLTNNPNDRVVYAIPEATVVNREGSGLNMRSGRSLSSRALQLVPNGAKVEVLGHGTTWHHVRYGGQTGYMLASKLSLPGEGAPSGSSSGSAGAGNMPVLAMGTVYNHPRQTDRLNLRDSINRNGTGGASMGKYYTGVRVQILEYLNVNGVGWAHVSVGGQQYGFMQLDYLRIDEKVGATPFYGPTVRVGNQPSHQRVNLRAAPSATSKSLAKYSNNTQVEVIGVVNNTWSHVRVGDNMGFIMNKYLIPQPTF